MLLPNEESTKIQSILNSDATLDRKSYRIEAFYKSTIPYNRNSRMQDQEEPPLNHNQIKAELVKRGDDLTAIDVEL